jgi:NAD(P)-dependent dehydrogenase (short-subunit alcohol dehydrogenase family)
MYGVKNTKVNFIAKGVEKRQLEGKNIVVIGGTSGIGQALARQAAVNGAEVTVVGRTQRDNGMNFVKADLSLITEAKRVASELPVETLDTVIFTVGIVPGKIRQETTEGVELDMAASALSRHVMLREMAGRLKATARVFIWGFPGSKGVISTTNVKDFNSELAYEGGFGTAHMNTVALNEALVHYWASKGMLIYGMNPGLIKTNIRNSMHGGGFAGSIMEFLINCFNPNVDKYARKILPLLIAPELNEYAGIMFGQKGTAILPSVELLNNGVVAEWIDAADTMVKQIAGN